MCARTLGRDSSFVITDVGRSVGSVRFGLVFSTSTIVCGMNEWNRIEPNEWERRVRVGDGGRATERERDERGRVDVVVVVVVVVGSRRCRSKEEEEEEIKPGCCVCGINSFSFRRETEANAPRSSGTNERRRRLWRGVSSSSSRVGGVGGVTLSRARARKSERKR